MYDFLCNFVCVCTFYIGFNLFMHVYVYFLIIMHLYMFDINLVDCIEVSCWHCTCVIGFVLVFVGFMLFSNTHS